LNKLMITAGLLAGCLLLGACAVNPRYAALSDDRGRSYETARYNQIINMEAGMLAGPVDGIDGIAGDLTYKKYQDGFKIKTPPTPVFNLNLGPGGS
jgi:hypothetical protein